MIMIHVDVGFLDQVKILSCIHYSQKLIQQSSINFLHVLDDFCIIVAFSRVWSWNRDVPVSEFQYSSGDQRT